MLRIVLLVSAATAMTACGLGGPSQSIAGTWRAPGIGHSGHSFELTLTQNDDTISGVACSTDGGFLLFEGAPVSGELPTVTFAHPVTGARFAGRFEADRDQIAGQFGFGAGEIPLRFVRSEAGRCAGSKPPPGS